MSIFGENRCKQFVSNFFMYFSSDLVKIPRFERNLAQIIVLFFSIFKHIGGHVYSVPFYTILRRKLQKQNLQNKIFDPYNAIENS